MTDPSRPRADETVTVRLPKGTADKLRAATGQPFSRLVRWTMLALLDKHMRENSQALTAGAEEVKEIVAEMPPKV